MPVFREVRRLYQMIIESNFVEKRTDIPFMELVKSLLHVRVDGVNFIQNGTLEHQSKREGSKIIIKTTFPR